MYRLPIAILGLAIAASAAQAQPDAKTVTYEAITAHAPEGISRLRVTRVEADSYAIDLAIVAPNATHHGGHIQGLATKSGKRLTLKVPAFQPDGQIDSPALCIMLIDVDDTSATVVSEDRCAGFHGAAASFVEQGAKLLRVR